MSVPQPPKPAKLIIGIFTQEKKIIGNLVPAFASMFGKIDLVSPWLPFDFTTYYETEMGSPLVRRVFAFRRSEKTVSGRQATVIPDHDLIC